MKYAAVSVAADGYFKYKTGRVGAATLQYEQKLLEDIPDEIMQSFCGVGNPFTISSIKSGSTVLDIGCGAGVDLYVASKLVGQTGSVYGTDITIEMVHQARQNLAKLGVDNARILYVTNEQLPFADNTFDIIISNGVINLSPDKPKLFREIFRVLRKNGRLQFADIILGKELPPHLAASAESWSQ